MSRHKKETIVIALGGSIVYPDEINTGFIKKFSKLVRDLAKKDKQFVIIIGGGRSARIYQQAASDVLKVADEDKDWIGIHATRLNAHLLRTIFKDVADPVVFDERHKRKQLKYPVTIASGWNPGWSTDYVAVALAHDYKAKHVIIAGKPSHVFDKDFTKYKNAKPFTELTWKEYRKLIPQKWTPGFHSPVDPIAAQLAQKEKITAIVTDGRQLQNLKNIIEGKKFEGTIIA